MTDDELYRCRCDLAERGFPADDWSDAEIEELPRWKIVEVLPGDYVLDLDGTDDSHWVDCPLDENGDALRDSERILEDVECLECIDTIQYVLPTNRLAILHLLPIETPTDA